VEVMSYAKYKKGKEPEDDIHDIVADFPTDEIWSLFHTFKEYLREYDFKIEPTITDKELMQLTKQYKKDILESVHL